jgi:long-chain acyl-CoA synthetase
VQLRSSHEPDSRRDGLSQIWVRAAGAPAEYIGSDRSRDPSRNDGWFDTGDLGYLDAAGRLTVTGQHVARINVGGKKVDPAEVEDAIREFAGVQDCAVLGQPSALSGESISAFVQAGPTLDEAALLRFLRSRLSDFKVPRRIRRVEQLPRTRSGKVRYGVLATS